MAGALVKQGAISEQLLTLNPPEYRQVFVVRLAVHKPVSDTKNLALDALRDKNTYNHWQGPPAESSWSVSRDRTD
ncbi:hypothetical protein RR46_08955 [Papilio xuthus]|uniref:Uncharacterized protein n=1 Tax=Papilio xuthus TaxID=66420 RepID=A0A194PPX4_PAPXU|nr:hypothetical protein RR46_08955 [Papilio xuthus]